MWLIAYIVIYIPLNYVFEVSFIVQQVHHTPQMITTLMDLRA